MNNLGVDGRIHSGGANVTLYETETVKKELKESDKDRSAILRNREYMERFYFLLDSDNCVDFRQKHLYGYVILRDKIYINCDLPDDAEFISFNAFGVFDIVSRRDNNIEIWQDWQGSGGLFLYQAEDGYFAVSNSFAKLLEYLKNKRSLHLNDDYAKYFLSVDLCSSSVEETLVSEIMCLAPEFGLEITCGLVPVLKVKQRYDPYSLYQVELASQKGMDILDAWYKKWCGIYTSIVNENQHLTIDVSGGFDSRIGVAILLSSGVDLSKVRFGSAHDDKHTHKEDWEIASNIAEEFGFELNRMPWENSSVVLPGRLAFENSLLLKMGLHKQMYYGSSYNKQYRFNSGGQGGENLRAHWVMPKEKFIQANQRRRFVTLDCRVATRHVLQRSYQNRADVYGRMSDFEYMPFAYVYRASRNRNHFGKSQLEKLFHNDIGLAPLMDFSLYRLKVLGKDNNDYNLLFALIIARYCPKLLSIRFEGGRSFDEGTVAMAQSISKQFPMRVQTQPQCFFSIVNGNVPDFDSLAREKRMSEEMPGQHMLDLFHHPLTKAYFVSRYGAEPYQDAQHRLKTLNFYPEEQACSVAAIAMVLRALDMGRQEAVLPSLPPVANYYADEERVKRQKSAGVLRAALDDILSARLDIKNSGTHNKVEIINNDTLHPYWIQQAPTWFTDEKGAGCILVGKTGHVDIKVKCIGSGELSISCKGVDRRDKDKKKVYPGMPVWTMFTSLCINGKELLVHPMEVWCNQTWDYRLKVEDCEEISLTADWLPYGYEMDELAQMVGRLMAAKN